jgi:hypothetical protein
VKKTGFILLSLLAGLMVARAQPANQLTDAEMKDGWKLLFDGKSSAGWHSFNKKTFGPGWKIADGTLYRDTTIKNAKDEEGDLCTDEVYENFDLKLQWKISKNGNSGIMFLVQESPEYD